MSTTNDNALLRVEDLHLHYRTMRGSVRAVDGVDFTLRRGEALVILGESGCGKTSLTKALLRLTPRNVQHLSGRILLDGRDIMGLGEQQFRREVSWRQISVVMQASMNSLNPVIRVGEQVAEPLCDQLGWSRSRALARAAETFSLVGLPEDFLLRYPFELSGGMRQRAVLAMALVTRPTIVVLDEPTSALDVLTQASVMNVLKQIRSELGTSFILITHDVATSSEVADRVALMYGGQIVELASAAQFFSAPAHPYAQMLMSSVPRLRERREPSHIPGQPPNLLDPPSGCRYATRCPSRFARCVEMPPLAATDTGRFVRCWLHTEPAEAADSGNRLTALTTGEHR